MPAMVAVLAVVWVPVGCTGNTGSPPGPDGPGEADLSPADARTDDGGQQPDRGPQDSAAGNDFAGQPDAGPVCAKGAVSGSLPPTSGVTVVVEGGKAKFQLSPVLVGANINQWFKSANGLWNPKTDAPTADAAAKAAKAGLGLLRFPGGTCANLFDWKRSVGPAGQRGCQTDAKTLVARTEQHYGLSEFIELTQAVGAEAQILVPFANESPEDAADWVEYMNAPQGTNPNGGVAWADRRAADGHPAPFNVTRWEIGNEHDRGGHQSYWMTKGSSPSEAQARLDQYIAGAEIPFVDQPMGRGCDFSATSATSTTSQPGQRFYLLYGLMKPGTFPKIKVGGTLWSRVKDLSSAGPGDKVYQLHRADGSITFGDGTHGAIPPAGQPVTASYTFKHQGFVAMADAMKAVAAQIGTPIQVCASWAPPATRGTPLSELGRPSFPQEMKQRGLAGRYDCVAMHPYTNFGRDFGSAWQTPEQAHHQHMVGDDWARTMVLQLKKDLQANAPGAMVTISELGALWFTDGNEGAALPNYSATMTHALYMASQWIHYARRNLGWVEGNTLVANANGLRGTLGGKATGFVYGAEAMTREALKPFFASGSTWIGSRVDNPELVTALQGKTYPALVVGASRGADGALRIALVNRRAKQKQVARVSPQGFSRGAQVQRTQVRGASFASYNDDAPGGGDDSVSITRSSFTATTADFDVTLPAASVTVLTLRPPCP